MFDVGVPELALTLVVALIVFGPGKLPEVGAALGKAIGEFRRATRAVNDEVQSITKFPEAEMRPALPSSVEATTVKANDASAELADTKN